MQTQSCLLTQSRQLRRRGGGMQRMPTQPTRNSCPMGSALILQALRLKQLLSNNVGFGLGQRLRLEFSKFRRARRHLAESPETVQIRAKKKVSATWKGGGGGGGAPVLTDRKSLIPTKMKTSCARLKMEIFKIRELQRKLRFRQILIYNLRLKKSK